MRTTQYIGLTKRAEKFVLARTPLASWRTFEGTCGEKIQLKEWLSNGEVFPSSAIIREVIQAMPWSCGAMIFTCLEVQYQNGEQVQFNHWVPCPMVKEKQYDKESGTYWV